MSWSYRFATVRQIDLRVHVTFAAIVLMAAANWASQGVAGMAFGIALILLLFTCVTLHELGHAFAAQWYGLPVRGIVLLPIGGVAFLGRATRNPIQELVIAAAGPAVNVAIVAVLAPLLVLLDVPLRLTPALLGPNGTEPSLATALQWLVGANVGLVLFNLIPAFPLDGGRILRGALGLVTDWARATRWATTMGQCLAAGMAAWGIASGQLPLVVVAAMVFFSAAAAGSEERSHGVLSTQPVGAACNHHGIRLTEADRLSTVTRHILTSYQPDFAVMRQGQLLGVVHRSQVIRALTQRQGDVPVTALMASVPVVAADASLADTRLLLAESGASVGAVFDAQGFLGLIGIDDIAEAEVLLASARDGASAPPALPGSSGHVSDRTFLRGSQAAPAES